MERLTWEDESGYYAPKNVTLNCLKQRGELVDRLAAYEDLEEQGRLIVLPCKVGDTVYEPTSRGTISTYLVRGFRIEPFDSIWLQWDIQTGFVYRNFDGVNADEIGKTVFLTREEAEAAMKGVSEDA